MISRVMSPLSVLLLVVVPVDAATRRVPTEYATIQAGLDASVAGDSVLVATGTYTHVEVRYLDGPFGWTACVFMVDGVVLKSESGPASTVISMQEAPGPQDSVVLARNLASPQTSVEGFTITTTLALRGSYLLGRMTYRNCIFQDLDANQSTGGGIAANGDLTLIGCEFVNCRAEGGGAIYHAHGRLEMYDTIVRDCGHIAVLGSGSIDPPVESALVEGCTFENCWNESSGGGALGIGSYYGGVVIRGCRFMSNEAGGTGGAGMSLGSLGPGSIVQNCLFINNRAVGGNGLGGAIKATSSIGALTVRGCTFWANYAPTVSGGAAVALGANGSALANNVIAGCQGYGAVYAYNVNLQSSCNVFWQNEGGQGQYYTPGSTDRVVDPLFCDIEAEDFHVMVGSPCVPPGSLDCGQIGLLGAGCGVVAVEPWSWGRVKSSFRAGRP